MEAYNNTTTQTAIRRDKLQANHSHSPSQPRFLIETYNTQFLTHLIFWENEPDLNFKK
jgi:hypothetical protein